MFLIPYFLYIPAFYSLSSHITSPIIIKSSQSFCNDFVFRCTSLYNDSFCVANQLRRFLNKRISRSTDFSTSCKTFYIKLLDDHLVSRRKNWKTFPLWNSSDFLYFTFLTILFFIQCLEVPFNQFYYLFRCFQLLFCIFY